MGSSSVQYIMTGSIPKALCLFLGKKSDGRFSFINNPYVSTATEPQPAATSIIPSEVTWKVHNETVVIIGIDSSSPYLGQL